MWRYHYQWRLVAIVQCKTISSPMEYYLKE